MLILDRKVGEEIVGFPVGAEDDPTKHFVVKVVKTQGPKTYLGFEGDGFVFLRRSIFEKKKFGEKSQKGQP